MTDVETKTKWFVDELLSNYPDVDNLVRKSFGDNFIRSIAYQPPELLSITMAALSRFLAHVQFFGNQMHAEAARLKRTFEGKKFTTIAGLQGVTDRTTGNVMLAKAYQANPELAQIEEQLGRAEEMAKYYDRMPDRLSEHIQVIKYELRRREGGRR